MKDVIKAVWLLVLGLFTTVLLYPALHEFGHSLATVLFGGKVVSFHLFPLPSVYCDVSDVGGLGLVAIGFCGTLIPFIASLTPRVKHFAAWYVLQLIKGISALAFGISLVSLLGHEYGFFIAEDDIIRVLRFWHGGKPFCVIAITSLLLLAIYSICRQKPIKRLYGYFDIKEK